MALLSKFFGRTVSEGAAFAFGVATGPVLSPAVEEIRQAAWGDFPTRAIEPGDVAGIVAENVELEPWGVSEAGRHGINAERFAALLGETLNAPGLGELFQAYRRNLIDDAEFSHGLRKAKLETRWDAPLKALKEQLLAPDVLANARQQGFVDQARAESESALQGVDAERSDILYELSGNPPGPETAQQYLNRGLIDPAEFAQIIREGRTKTKYTDLLERARVFVLTPINYVEGRLRGWLTDAEMYAGTALHGVTQADTDLLFKIHGRPISFHQTFIGTRRGGTLDGPTADIDPAFLASLRRSNIQPSFYNLAWAQRYVYPSAFVLRALVQAGDITAADAIEVLHFEGWEPTFATKAVNAWASGGGTAGKALTKTELLSEYEGLFITETELRTALTALGYTGTALDLEVQLGNARRVKKYRDAVVTAIHDAYLVHDIDDATATSELADANVSGTAASDILHQWQVERRVTIRDLTPAQIAKAVKKGILTHDVGIARLEDMGYTPDDAATLIAET